MMKQPKSEKHRSRLLTLAFGGLSLFLAFLTSHILTAQPVYVLLYPPPLIMTFLLGGGIAFGIEAIIRRARSEKEGMILSSLVIPLAFAVLALILNRGRMYVFLLALCLMVLYVLIYWALKAVLRRKHLLTW